MSGRQVQLAGAAVAAVAVGPSVAARHLGVVGGSGSVRGPQVQHAGAAATAPAAAMRPSIAAQRPRAVGVGRSVGSQQAVGGGVSVADPRVQRTGAVAADGAATAASLSAGGAGSGTAAPAVGPYITARQLDAVEGGRPVGRQMARVRFRAESSP